MKRNFFSALLLTISLTAFIACGNNAYKKDKTETAATTEADKKQDAAGNAADCGTTAISFGTDKIKSEGFTMKYSEAVLWNMASGETKYPAIIIQVANYAKEGSYLQAPVGDNVRAMITISGKSGEKLQPGDYEIGGSGGFGAGYAVSGGIENKDGSKGFVNAKGKATITYLADDKVCGTIDVSDGTSFIKGSFSMALTKSAY
ncbi:MAG: hypothetical protein WAU23_12900 [Ferruginibacter sp.]